MIFDSLNSMDPKQKAQLKAPDTPNRPGSRQVFTTRRHFLRQVAGSLLAAPFVTSGLMAASPNAQLRHASFGASGMAWNDINSLTNTGKIDLVAVADVDTRHFARIKENFPGVRCFQDAREMMSEFGDTLDSVNVSTPDHMHGAQALDAMEKGIHVYGQKPLAQNIAECRALTLKARESGVVTQMGIQLSSSFSERLVAEIVSQGQIGKVREVHTFSHKHWGDPDPRPERSDSAPAELDWDFWLGVAPERPYIDDYYHPQNWRRRRDFGTGTLGDMGCHMFSSWFRALRLDAPISVRSIGGEPNEHNWGNNLIIEYIFPGSPMTEEQEIKVNWYDGDQRPPGRIAKLADGDLPSQGSVLVGTDGVLVAPHGSTPLLYPREKFGDYRYPKLEARNHYSEFVEACLRGSGARPSANFDYAGPLSEIVLLGCIASAFPGETMRWDPKAMKVDHDGANGLMRREYRPGWEIKGV